MKKAAQLRELFDKKGVIRLVGAHDGLTSKLVEKNGFEGVWASGLEISTAHAVPDANILTMSEFWEAAKVMNDSVSIPVIADCDTGFGNSNNVMYMVRKYEAAGIAAVCIEDKKFPKVNSYIPGRQELAPISEFVGKILAAKNAQQTSEFIVIARVEALIAGWGQQEALKRADAYVEAGADAILIHSKAKSPCEIVEFANRWNDKAPLVVVPTTYPQLTIKELEELGIKMVIYANHGLRASIKAINEVFSEIYKTGSLLSVDDKIASMREVFEIQGMPRMKEEEKKFLRTQTEPVKAIIPAAGSPRDQESLEFLLKDRPVAMLDINGKPLLQRNIETLNKIAIGDITVITGHKSEAIDIEGINLIYNEHFDKTDILHSIMCAEEKLEGRILMIYSDILFEDSIIERLLKVDSDIALVVDCSFRRTNSRHNKQLNYVITKNKPVLSNRIISNNVLNPVLRIGVNIPDKEADYEFIGIAYFSEKGTRLLKEYYYRSKERYKSMPFHEAKNFSVASITDLFQELIDNDICVDTLEVNSGWMEIHTFENYKQACSLLSLK